MHGSPYAKDYRLRKMRAALRWARIREEAAIREPRPVASPAPTTDQEQAQ